MGAIDFSESPAHREFSVPKLLYAVLLCLLLPTGAVGSKPTPRADIELQRLSFDQWRANVSLARPVTGYRVYPANLAFRRNWRVLTPGMSLEETEQGGLITAQDGSFAGTDTGCRFSLPSVWQKTSTMD